MTDREPSRPLVLRLTHWVGAVAMLCMILSGWQIYNASPILPFTFPIGLGGWLGAGIAWHIAAMWVLMLDGVVYLTWALASGHFRRDFLPLSPREFTHDLGAALRFRLTHDSDRYNAVQRVLYAGVLIAAIGAVLTGLSIWKPVQFAPLTRLFDGYPTARVLHFCMMSAIVLFLIVHVTLVAIVPATLRRMIYVPRRARP